MPSGMKQKRKPNRPVVPGLRIGLTGGVASGKSTVAKLFASKDWAVLDADQINRALMSPGGRAHGRTLALFGTDDRKAIRAKVFQDPGLREKLEALMHPLIAEESDRIMSEWSEKGKNVLYEAALLAETDRANMFDGIVLVSAPLEQRLARLMARDQIDEKAARAIIDAQWDDDARRKAIRVPVVEIENNGDEKRLEASVESAIGELFKRLRP